MTEDAPRRQRVGAYAVVLRGDDILLTQMSSRTRIEGRWTLPGGGIDHGEDPRAGVVREVYEETGLQVRIVRVLDVHSVAFVGPRSDGVVEDYHGLHIIYEATVAPDYADVTPHVVEEDGSTAACAWVPVARARRLRLLSAASHALDHLLPTTDQAGT